MDPTIVLLLGLICIGLIVLAFLLIGQSQPNQKQP